MVVWRAAAMAFLRVSRQPVTAPPFVERPDGVSTIVVELGRQLAEQQPRVPVEGRDLGPQRAAVDDAGGPLPADGRHGTDGPGAAELQVAGRDQAFLARAVVAVAVDDGQPFSLVRQHDAEACAALGARHVDGRTGGWLAVRLVHAAVEPDAPLQRLRVRVGPEASARVLWLSEGAPELEVVGLDPALRRRHQVIVGYLDEQHAAR